MYACVSAGFCCAATEGRLDGADIDADPGKGGSWFISKGGGGGRPSADDGECELFRTSELSEGENMPLGGNRGFMDAWFHG